jgi:hypothetical protein
MIEFAQNPPVPGALAEISSLIASTRDGHWAALVDTAFDYLKKQTTPFIAEAINVYDNGNDAFASLRIAAPVLMPLPSKEVPEWLATLVEHCGARPMLSFIKLPKDIAWSQLVKQWEPLHRLHNPDGTRMLLRFADTRSLALLPQVLKPEQWWTWHKNIVEWRYLDRAGYFTLLPLEKTAHPLVQRTEVDDAQLARLTDAAEADSALDFILYAQPAALPESISGYRYHVAATNALAKATQYGIENWQDRVAIVSLAAVTDGKILEDSEANQWLAARTWESGCLGNVLTPDAAPWLVHYV